MTPKIDPWGTHLPLLVAAVVNNPTGRVIELGCGLYSTPVLRALCGDRLTSVESDKAWAAKFGKGVVTDHWRGVVESGEFAVALVDHAPPAERAPAIAALRGRCRVIVCHDSEHRLYDMERELVHFKYRKEWKRYAPWTTAVSDVDPMNYMDGHL